MQLKQLIILIILLLLVGGLGWKACEKYKTLYPEPTAAPQLSEDIGAAPIDAPVVAPASAAPPDGAPAGGAAPAPAEAK